MTKSVYIHIPFCKNICNYCDFCKLYYDKKYINNYLDNLEKEISSRYRKEVIDTIYIGGGTPSCLEYDELKRLFNIIKIFKCSDNFEYSIESNIESLDIDKIKLFKEFGINRVSLGVQSFDDEVLKILNRHHNKDMVDSVIQNIKNVGINNINIDLIYGSVSDINILKKDIDYFIDLDISHISCYSLIIEDNTVFGNSNREYISEDIEYEMYKYIKDKLIKNAYIHYEISNYAKEGYESRHNINYWDNGCYYGFGLGSVSYIDNYRINNTRNLSKYLNGTYEDSSIYEDVDIRMSNDMILGLRKTRGVNIRDFYNKYNRDIREVFDINDYINKDMLIIDGDYLYISDDYLYLSNDILVNFIS